MGNRNAVLWIAAIIVSGCVRPVSLIQSDLARLRARADIPVVYQGSGSPWVDCPTGEGESVWRGPSASLDASPRANILASDSRDRNEALAAASSGSSSHDLIFTGTLWEDFQAQRTRGLEVPPNDPARATGDDFIALARQASRAVPFRGSVLPAQAADRSALARRFGSVPVLVFKSTRWVLVGCWYNYKPWFDVRATLVDLGTGKVLWRDVCGETFPPDSAREYSPTELEANGDTLYARIIDERAEGCARELFSSFNRGAAPTNMGSVRGASGVEQPRSGNGR